MTTQEETEMEVPPNSLQREEVNNNDLGRWSPWWGGRQEGTSDLQHSWSQFLGWEVELATRSSSPQGVSLVGNTTTAPPLNI